MGAVRLSASSTGVGVALNGQVVVERRLLRGGFPFLTYFGMCHTVHPSIMTVWSMAVYRSLDFEDVAPQVEVDLVKAIDFLIFSPGVFWTCGSLCKLVSTRRPHIIKSDPGFTLFVFMLIVAVR